MFFAKRFNFCTDITIFRAVTHLLSRKRSFGNRLHVPYSFALHLNANAIRWYEIG